MALQKSILKRGVDLTATVGSTDKNWTSATGTLAGGIPGKIYDVAYGPVVHTVQLDAASEIGKYVAGKGVIINAPEYALVGTADGALVPSLAVRKGTVVECMTAGHVWIKSSEYSNIIGSGKMAGRKLWGPDPLPDVSSAVAYATGTAYAVNAILKRKDINQIETYYKVTTAITAAENTDWDAVKGKTIRLGAVGDLCVIEVNGFAA